MTRIAVDVVLLGVGYAAYTGVRNAVRVHHASAVRRGAALLHLEQFVRLNPERALNAAVAAHPAVADLFDYYYATLHFVVVLAVLAWLYWRHPRSARRWAAVWYAMNLIALLGFWLLPTAPPRLLPGGAFVDTVVRFHTWGSWGDGAVAAATNQYAAFPSLHVGWSLWAALAVRSLTRHRVVRAAAVGYPLLTAAVVVGTANHYVIDVLAGGLTCLLGLATVRLVATGVGCARSERGSRAARARRDQRLSGAPGRWRPRVPALILILITVVAVVLGAAAGAALPRRSAGRRRLGWASEGMPLDRWADTGTKSRSWLDLVAGEPIRSGGSPWASALAAPVVGQPFLAAL